ncbi:MAG: hypothetical protein AAGB51_07970 [Planctomycetota bacterium]
MPEPEPISPPSPLPAEPSDDIDAVWSRFLTLAAAQRTIAGLVARTHCVALGGGHAKIQTGDLAPAILNPFKDKIEDLMSRAVGARTSVEFIAPEHPDQPAAEEADVSERSAHPIDDAANDPLVQAVLEVFGGEILDVREKPRPTGEDEANA